MGGSIIQHGKSLQRSEELHEDTSNDRYSDLTHRVPDLISDPVVSPDLLFRITGHPHRTSHKPVSGQSPHLPTNRKLTAQEHFYELIRQVCGLLMVFRTLLLQT